MTRGRRAGGVFLLAVATSGLAFFWQFVSDSAIVPELRTSVGADVFKTDRDVKDGPLDNVGMTDCSPNITYFDYAGKNITCDTQTLPHPMADCYSYPIDLWSRSIRPPNIPFRIFQIGQHKIATRSLTAMASRIFRLPAAHHRYRDGKRNFPLIRASMENRDCHTPLLTNVNHLIFYSDFSSYGWKQLAFEYPHSLFILNIRPISSWLVSRANHLNGKYMNLAGRPECQDVDKNASLSCVFSPWKRRWYNHYCPVLDFFHSQPKLRRNILLLDIENKQVTLSATLESFLGRFFVARTSKSSDAQTGKTSARKETLSYPLLDAVNDFSSESERNVHIWNEKNEAGYQELDACKCVCDALGYKARYNLRDDFPNNLPEIGRKAVVCPSDVAIRDYLDDPMIMHLNYSLV